MMNHMRQIGMVCMEFELAYGTYPSDAAAAAVATDIGVNARRLAGPDVLNQLEACGADPEPLLTVGGTAEGDWIYFPGRRTSDGDPIQPVLVSPVIRGRAAVLRLDGSVTEAIESEVERLRLLPGAVEIPAPRR